MLNLNEIICEDCGLAKPVRFYKTAKFCDECSKVRQARSKAEKRSAKRKSDPTNHSKRDFESDLWKNYRLTLNDYNVMYEKQKGCCDCCGRHESEFKRKLHVDHCHATGQVRALLCTRCNPGIGYFEDSVEKLEMAIAYLKKFKK